MGASLRHGKPFEMRSPESKIAIEPVHASRALPIGTLKSILKQAEIPPEELTELRCCEPVLSS